MIKSTAKRIFYIPGMIALLTLPIIGIIRINHELRKRTEYCIPLIVLDSATIKDYKFYYSVDVPPKRNYIEIVMNGNQFTDSSKLPLIQYIGRGIDQSKDTTLGLKIVFSNTAKYSTYISAINELLKGRVQTYAPIEDTIFAFYINRTDSCKTSNLPDNYSCIEFIYIVDSPLHSVEEKRQAKLNEIKSMFKLYIHYWPIYLVILILIIINIQKIRKIKTI